MAAFLAMALGAPQNRAAGGGGAFGGYGDHPVLLGNREDPPSQAGYGPGYGGNRPANPYDPHYSPVIPGYSGY